MPAGRPFVHEGTVELRVVLLDLCTCWERTSVIFSCEPLMTTLSLQVNRSYGQLTARYQATGLDSVGSFAKHGSISVPSVPRSKHSLLAWLLDNYTSEIHRCPTCIGEKAVHFRLTVK